MFDLNCNVFYSSFLQVRAGMQEIQSCIDDNDLEGWQVFNGDETGINWAVQLKHQYVPRSSKRGKSPGGDTSGRFTMYYFGNSEGDMAPIVKVACTYASCMTSTLDEHS